MDESLGLLNTYRQQKVARLETGLIGRTARIHNIQILQRLVLGQRFLHGKC